MATIEEMRARAQQLQATPELSDTGTPPAIPATDPVTQSTVSATSAAAATPKTRSFHHPVAGSTTIMPNGKVLTFVGHISGQGDRRIVGAGICETADTDEITWLESVAKMKGNQVSEIQLANTGEVAGVLTPKSPNPLDNKALADAVANTVKAADDPNDKGFTAKLVHGTQTDLAAGATIVADTSMQQALASVLAAGDQSKPGTVHNG